MTTGEKLKKLRNETKLTQNQVIAKLNNKISKNTLVNAENDKCKMKGANDATLTILAEFYDVDIDYLRNDNCNVKKKENKKIAEQLGLSEQAINKIKDICFINNNYSDSKNNTNEITPDVVGQNGINSFIESFDLKYFLYRLEEYKKLVSIRIVVNEILSYNEVILNLKKKVNVEKFKKIILDYDNLVQKTYKLLSDRNNTTIASEHKEYLYNYDDFNNIFDSIKCELFGTGNIKDYQGALDFMSNTGTDLTAKINHDINQKHFELIQLFEQYLKEIKFN